MKVKLALLILLVAANIVAISPWWALAAQVGGAQLTVNATVSPCAVSIVSTSPMNFEPLTGPNQVLGPRDHAIFRVSANSLINMTFSAGDLTLMRGSVPDPGSTLKTRYEVTKDVGGLLGTINRENDANWTPKVGNLVVENENPRLPLENGFPREYSEYIINGWVRTGDVSSQEWGTYKATITLTVFAHL